MRNIIDKIGFFGPVIIFLISIYNLWNQQKYLISYLVFSFCNTIVNKILKVIIQQKRPNGSIKIMDESYEGIENYGMPSGHAQTCAYNLAFVTLVLNNAFITGLYLVITFISMYQRHKYGNHTILQLIIGFIVGIIFGYLVFFAGNKWLKGNLMMKLDDYAPK